MATIITVHGTNATGAPVAEKSGKGHWWQKDSYFEHHLRELVEAEDGELEVEPHVWDGQNSETSRWKAGVALFQLARPLENDQKRYVLIGHSHGGSVIRHFLEWSAYNRKKLDHLGSWITVGTPFIYSKPTTTLFSQLTLWTKSAYLIAVLFVMFALMFAMKLAIHVNNIGTAVTSAIVLLLALSVFAVLRSFQQTKLKASRSSRTRNALKTINAPLHVSLYHSSDEAIQGLKLLRSTSVHPISRTFATDAMLLCLLFGAVIALIVIASSRDTTLNFLLTVMNALGDEPLTENTFLGLFSKLGVVSFDMDSFADRLTMLIMILTVGPPFILFTYLPISYSDILARFGALDMLAFFVTLLIMGILLQWAIINSLLFGIRFLGNIISSILSKVLNRVVQAQIFRTGLGGDYLGERVVKADQQPPWVEMEQKPIERQLEQEISAMSDEAAAVSVQKFRAALSQLALSEGASDANEAVADYLTWKELIHTTYFYVPRFRKLVAYAICQCEGFRPTESFKSDPDYTLVAGWYDALRSEDATL